MDGSLPDITADLKGGDTWDHLHSALRESELRWEYWYDGALMTDMASADELFSPANDGAKLLKVWVGPYQFNGHYFVPTELDFDVEVAVLGSRSGHECLVAFMDLLATVTGSHAVMTHEGSEAIIRISEPFGDVELASEAVHLADLRNPFFVEYRGVIVPRSMFSRSNVDLWLETYPDPDRVSSTISHVHMSDTIQSVETVDGLSLLAEEIAARWTGALRAQFPDSQFEVGVSNELDEGDPTVWMRRTSSAW